jgi:small-conductance mechanosensitive channel
MSNTLSVLATKKPEVVEKKGKGWADAKWEAEIRQKLNAKKTQVTLSKQDQALVNEQLQKEEAIRKRVSETRAKLDHGLELANALSSANVEEFRAYAPQIASILYLNAFYEASEALVGDKAFNTFLVRLFSSAIPSCADVLVRE